MQKIIKMKSYTALFAFLTVFAFTGCAEYGDDGGEDPGPTEPYCGDNVCNGDEDSNSCPNDCGGPDLSDPPPANSGTWACRPGVDSHGDDYVEFKAQYLHNGSEPTAMIVGDCPSEGITGYWTGTKLEVRQENGWYRLYLAGASAECTLTYSVCSNTSDPNCWAQYGLGTFPSGSTVPGPYRDCSQGTCGCTFSRNPGAHATPLGD